MRLGNVTLKSPLSNAALTTRFGVYSFICIGVMTAALWFMVSNYLINQILDREWQTTAQMVRADVRKFLEAYDFKAQDRKSVGPKFVALLDHMRLAPEILRFRVYNPRAVVIWSDDKSLVGKSFTDNPQLQKALKGSVIAKLDLSSTRENVSEQRPESTAVQVYVPIYSESGKELLGVFETYRRPEGIFQAIHEARLIVLLGAVGGGLLLYVSLFAIVRQAAKKIAEQQENLLQMQSELVASQRMAVMGEMAAAVAHGIGTPLSSIRAAAQVAMLDACGNGSEKNDKMEENLPCMRFCTRSTCCMMLRKFSSILSFFSEPWPQASSMATCAAARIDESGLPIPCATAAAISPMTAMRCDATSSDCIWSRFSCCSAIFFAACRTMAKSETYKSRPPPTAPKRTMSRAS